MHVRVCVCVCVCVCVFVCVCMVSNDLIPTHLDQLLAPARSYPPHVVEQSFKGVCVCVCVCKWMYGVQ